MGLWGKDNRGILLLDEVDLLLHPLTSELNFPIGDKKPLDQRRWDCPIHLFDALFYSQTEHISLPDFKASDEAITILQEFRSALHRGQRQYAVQGSPHPVLLKTEFYEKHLKTLLARWGLIWLCSQPSIRRDVFGENVTEEKGGGGDSDRNDLLSPANLRTSERNKRKEVGPAWLSPRLYHH